MGDRSAEHERLDAELDAVLGEYRAAEESCLLLRAQAEKSLNSFYRDLREDMSDRQGRRLGSLKSRVETIVAKIDELRRDDPAIPALDGSDSMDLVALRNRLASKRLELGRMKVLAAQPNNLAQQARRERVAELESEVESVAEEIRRRECKRAAAATEDGA